MAHSMAHRKLTSILLLSLTAILASCSNNDNANKTNASADEPLPVDKTYVVFSPRSFQMPLPNDILFGLEDDEDGTMFAIYDPTNPVLTGIDYLDGNSVVGSYDIQFSGSLNPAQIIDATSFVTIEGALLPNPNQNVFLLPLTFPSGDGLSQAKVNGVSVEVPTFTDAASYQAAIATGDTSALSELAIPTARAELISLNGGVNNTIRISPLHPLKAETKYLVIVTSLEDASGSPVYPSIAYDFIKDPESNLTGTDMEPVREAIIGWEQLAAGYLSFVTSVYEAAGIHADLPSANDILLAMTFTTAGTDSVLKSVAAPEIFFDKSLRTQYKQAAISKLVAGTYNLQADNSSLTDATDIGINTTINLLLSSTTIPGTDTPNPLYNEGIAAAIAAGANYTTVSEDATAAHIMQRAAAEAAISVHDSGGAIGAEAAGTVSAIAAAVSPVPLSSIFPLPAPRATSFYRVDAASSINDGLIAPALVYQGQIDLPVYQAPPASADDGTNIADSTWLSSETIGGIIDPTGATPRSEKVTYRYPFPAKAADITAPIIATLPEPTTLGNFGITKPADGWPVIIFVHGITTDRSASLPMADALAFACINSDLTGPSGAPCFATVAIDLPLHGANPLHATVDGIYSVTDPDHPPVANLAVDPSSALTERHYDFTADLASNPVPMDYSSDFGASGSLFINLSNFANSRDSLRQAVIDLLNLNASLATMDVDGDGLANDLDTSKVYLIGHSLGAIAGLTFTTVNNDPNVQASTFSDLPKIKAASSMFAGGEVTRLLVNSQSFGQRILPGLAAASDSLVQGNSSLELYLSVYQGIFDSVDPINFVGALADNGDTGVLLSEIVGSSTSPSDTVIPNAADTIWGANKGPLSTTLSNGFVIDNFPAPLAGTKPLHAQMNPTKALDVVAGTDPIIMVSSYTEGSHSTPVAASNTEIDPFTSGDTFYELLQQTVTFFALDGVPLTGSIVSNSDIIEP